MPSLTVGPSPTPSPTNDVASSVVKEVQRDPINSLSSLWPVIACGFTGIGSIMMFLIFWWNNKRRQRDAIRASIAPRQYANREDNVVVKFIQFILGNDD